MDMGAKMEELRREEPFEDTAAVQAGELKKARRHFSKLGWGFVLESVLWQGLPFLIVSLVNLWMPELMKNADRRLLIGMLPNYLISVPALVLLMRKIPAEMPKRHTMKPGHFVLAAIMAFSLMYTANIIGTVITFVISIFKRGAVQNDLVNIVMSVNPLAVLLIMVICAPILEELMFRKLIVDRTIRYGQGTAVVVSGLMFGLFHGNLNQFIYASVLGMFLAFLYVKTGNLKITIGIHMLVNLMGGVISTAVLKLLDLEALLELQEGGMQSGALTDYYMEHWSGMLIYMAYVFLILGITIAGFVLWIVFAVKKKFAFGRGESVIPKGKRFETVILNLGMALYCIGWIGVIVYELLQ